MKSIQLIRNLISNSSGLQSHYVKSSGFKLVSLNRIALCLVLLANPVQFQPISQENNESNNSLNHGNRCGTIFDCDAHQYCNYSLEHDLEAFRVGFQRNATSRGRLLGFCQCQEGFHWEKYSFNNKTQSDFWCCSDTDNSCEPALPLGSICNFTDCGINAACFPFADWYTNESSNVSNQTYCQCAFGYVPSENGNNCTRPSSNDFSFTGIIIFTFIFTIPFYFLITKIFDLHPIRMLKRETKVENVPVIRSIDITTQSVSVYLQESPKLELQTEQVIN